MARCCLPPNGQGSKGIRFLQDLCLQLSKIVLFFWRLRFCEGTPILSFSFPQLRYFDFAFGFFFSWGESPRKLAAHNRFKAQTCEIPPGNRLSGQTCNLAPEYVLFIVLILSLLREVLTLRKGRGEMGFLRDAPKQKFSGGGWDNIVLDVCGSYHPRFRLECFTPPSQTRASRGLMRAVACFVPPPPALIPHVFSCRCDIPCRYTNSLAAMRDTARCPRFPTEVGRSLLLYSPSWWHENSDAFFNR